MKTEDDNPVLINRRTKRRVEAVRADHLAQLNSE